MSAPEQSIGRRPGFVAGFAMAVAFFTRIPIGTPAEADWQLAQAAWAFPLVGAGVGAVAAFVFVIAQLIGLGDWPAALLAVTASLVLTGALHEDGLADSADGLFGGADRDRRLAIMRDSRLGTYGACALAMSEGRIPWVAATTCRRLRVLAPFRWRLARSSAAACLAKARASMTAPMNSDRSAVTSPIVSDSTWAMKSSRMRLQIDWGR